MDISQTILRSEISIVGLSMHTQSYTYRDNETEIRETERGRGIKWEGITRITNPRHKQHHTIRNRINISWRKQTVVEPELDALYVKSKVIRQFLPRHQYTRTLPLLTARR